MRTFRLALAALALLALGANAPDVRRTPGRTFARTASRASKLPVRLAASYPLSGNGAAMSDDAGTTTHVTFASGRTNLATYSNSVGATGWGATNVTRAGNAAVAPDSTTTATSYSATNSTSNYISDGPWVPTLNTAYTISVYAKSASGTQHFRLYADGGFGASGGTCQAMNDQAATTSWQRFQFSCVSSASSTSQGYFYVLTGTNYGLTALGAAIYLWGYQVEPNNAGPATALIPTTTTAVTTDAVTDSNGLTWSQSGYPSITAVPGVTTARNCATPSSANYYAYSGSALDFASDFTACAVFTKTGSTATALVGDWSASAGWKVEPQANGTVRFTTQNGASAYTVSTANTYVTGNATNVVCWGRAGNTMLVKLNGGATASFTAGGLAPAATSTNAWLGYGGGASALDGGLAEFWASTATPSDTVFAGKMAEFMGTLSVGGALVTVTRNFTAAIDAPGAVHYAPPNVLRFGAAGAIVEGTATNLLPWSRVNTDGSHGWAQMNLGGVTFTATAPDGTATATDVAPGGAAQQYVRISLAPVSGHHYVYSIYLRGNAGGEQVKLYGDADTWPLDSGVISLTTAWTRYSVPVTAISNNTRSLYVLAGTGYGMTAAARYFVWGAQVEETPVDAPSSLIATAGAPVVRPADVLSVAWPTISNSEWTVAGTFKPFGAWKSMGLFGAGTYQAASSWSGQVDGSGAIAFNAYDVTPAAKTSSGASGFASASSHRVVFNQNGGALLQYADGSVRTTSTTGTGTGAFTPAATLVVGGDTNGAGVNGYLTDVRICEGSSPAGDCAPVP